MLPKDYSIHNVYHMRADADDTYYCTEEGEVHRPRYEHDDCGKDIFLGRYHEYDLWTSPQGSLPTVIARESSEPEDYQSGMVFALGRLLGQCHEDPVSDALLVALKRGMNAGVLQLTVKWTGPV